MGVSVGAGGSFLLPDQRAGLAASVETYYCRDLGVRWIAEAGAGFHLTSLHTRFNLDWANHEDSTAGISSLGIPLRVRYVIRALNLAPSAGLSYERMLATSIAIDSVEQGRQGAWLQQRRYDDRSGVARDNLYLLLGLAYLTPNRRVALGLQYSRNLFDWAESGYPDARVWSLSLQVDVLLGLKRD